MGRMIKKYLRKIKFGVYDTSKLEYVSNNAKDLLEKMLEKNVEKRYSALDCLASDWFTKEIHQRHVDTKTQNKILANLKTFNNTSKLYGATLSYIVNQLTNKNEFTDLREMFNQFDTNNDGKLSLEEIIEGYAKIGSMDKSEVEDIFYKIDTDGNGYVSYDEFILASIDRKNLMTDVKLRKSFELFDLDGNGYIEAKEIKQVLGQDISNDEKFWTRIIAEVDKNGDGQISFDEFKAMMDIIINKNI